MAVRQFSGNDNAPLDQGRTRHGVVLLLTAVMPIMAIISLVPVLPLLLSEFEGVEGSAVLVPVALTIPALCIAVFSPFAGWLSDRLGRKPIMIAALLVYAAIGVLPWFLTNLYSVIASRIVLGVTEAAIMTVSTALIGDYFTGERRERWISLQVAVSSISAIFLVALGGAMGEAFGSRGPFLLYLLALPVAAIAAFVLFEPKRSAPDTQRHEVMLPLRRIMPPVAITLGAGIVFYTMIVQLGPILQLSGIGTPAMIGAAGAVVNLGVGLGTVLFRLLSRHVGPLLLALGLACAAVGYAGAGLAANFVVIAAFATLASIGGGIMLPNMLTWTMRLLPPPARGRGTGFWTAAFFLGQFIAPLIAGALTEPMGGLAAVLIWYAVIIAIASIAAFIISRRDPDVAAESVGRP